MRFTPGLEAARSPRAPGAGPACVGGVGVGGRAEAGRKTRGAFNGRGRIQRPPRVGSVVVRAEVGSAEAATVVIGTDTPEQEAKRRELRERGLQLPSYADADLQAALAQLKKAFEGVPGRGSHSSTFQLNLSALYGVGGARRDCVARV